MNKIKHGDFSQLAKHYINRPGYSNNVLEVIGNHIKHHYPARDIVIAELGAGTGKLTECLLALGYTGYSVEPNKEMLAEGRRYISRVENCNRFIWRKGTAEASGLPDNCAEWAIMGSSFHWAKTSQALAEFNRILKQGGFFTAIYNPRNIEASEWHTHIEHKIYEMVPGLNRVSSGSKSNMADMEERLLSLPCFGELFFVEGAHIEIMSRERYIGVWQSVNDIRVQAGEVLWQEVMEMIRRETKNLSTIEVPYKTRAWTIRKL